MKFFLSAFFIIKYKEYPDICEWKHSSSIIYAQNSSQLQTTNRATKPKILKVPLVLYAEMIGVELLEFSV